MGMIEAEWVELMATRIRKAMQRTRRLEVKVGMRLAYGYEILSYGPAFSAKPSEFQTDLVIVEASRDGSWKPRVVIEAKIDSVTTHDAITYSNKAASHRAVHPYLRYGIMLGGRRDFPLPGRLYRHGAHFDFMASFRGTRPTRDEIGRFVRLLRTEVDASRALETMLFESRKRDRPRYTLLHRKLVVR